MKGDDDLEAGEFEGIGLRAVQKFPAGNLARGRYNPGIQSDFWV